MNLTQKRFVPGLADGGQVRRRSNLRDNSGPASQCADALGSIGRIATLPPYFLKSTTPDFHKRFFMSSSLSSYSVRPAIARDARAIAEIHVATWQATYADLMPADYLASISIEKRFAFWREAIEFSDPQLLVATDGEKIVGFVGFDRSRDTGSKSSTGEIWAMYVSPEHWGKGLGLALWDGAREGLKEEGCTHVTLWVLLKNERALRFYEDGAGFKREMPSLKTVAFGSVRLEEIRLKRLLD